jgi:hypothetical protein
VGRNAFLLATATDLYSGLQEYPGNPHVRAWNLADRQRQIANGSIFVGAWPRAIRRFRGKAQVCTGQVPG